MPKMVTVGVVALDDVRTPFGDRKNILGGSATFSSFAASLLTEVGLSAVVGNDFPEKYLELLKSSGISLEGLEIRGKTFRWEGYYEGDMNSAVTTHTELNSFQDFSPTLPAEYKKAEYLFLANMDPAIQLSIIEQMKAPKLISLDTMNYWIENTNEKLLEVIGRVDALLINEGEAEMLFKTQDPEQAGRQALEMGPKIVVIKKGSKGASLYTREGRLDMPAIKLKAIDPTGAGDTFAGGFVGYLAKSGDLSAECLKKAMAYGTAMASFAVKGFSLDGLRAANSEKLKEMIQGLVSKNV